jgi:Response regulators consisting of a CheY-like receiver domain and a winged-helix DNA-binding domain
MPVIANKTVMNIRILVIDDEEAICEIIKFNLEKEGYSVDCAYSAEEALEMDLKPYDLFIVDIMMERLSGFDFAKALRSNSATDEVPIIFCSALNGEDDTVMGLNIGADGYITKPFSISEMLARVNAVLRRAAIQRRQAKAAAPATSDHIYEPQLTYKTLRIDPNEKICWLDDAKVALTKTEFEILSFFLSHPNRIYSREEIIRHVWSGDVVVTNRTIDTNITRLRKKIGRYGNNIETRLGFGYGFTEEN